MPTSDERRSLGSLCVSRDSLVQLTSIKVLLIKDLTSHVLFDGLVEGLPKLEFLWLADHRFLFQLEASFYFKFICAYLFVGGNVFRSGLDVMG